MGNFTFENQGTNTFLVYTIEDNMALDTLSLGMLTNNKIEGIISVIYTQMDNTKYLKYNISSKVSLQQYFQGMVTKKQFLGVFLSIAKTMLLIDEYMIIPGSIILDMDRIYVDVSSGETGLLCLPLVNKNSVVDMGSFFKNLVFSTKFNPNENCNYVTRLINYLNSAENFSLFEFKNLIQKILEEDNIPNSYNGGKQPVSQPMGNPVPGPAGNTVPQPMGNPAAGLTGNVASQPMGNPVSGLTGNVVSQPMGNPAAGPTGNVVSQPMGNPAAGPTGNVIPQPMGNPVSGPTGNTAPQPVITKGRLWPFGKKNKVKKGDANVAYNNQGNNRPPVSGQMNRPNFAGNSIVQPGYNSIPQQMQTPGQINRQNMQTPGQTNRPNMQTPGQINRQNMQTPGQTNRPNMQTPGQTNRPNMKMPGQEQNYSQTAMGSATVGVPLPAQTEAKTASGQQGGNFGETIVLNQGGTAGETTVLNSAETQTNLKPFLIRKKTGERILVTHEIFKLGKEPTYADYCIGDNSAVSRSHANIVTRGQQYYIVDTNSKNHTFLDGNMIAPNVELPLSNGSKIKLANEEFEFKLL